MTIKELSNYFYINKQIRQLQNKLSELEEKLISGSHITDMPISGNVSKPTEEIAVKIAELKILIVEKRNKLIDENIVIEKYIDTITDPKVQTIIRMRFIECKTWMAISSELECERTTPYYKIKKYLQNI